MIMHEKRTENIHVGKILNRDFVPHAHHNIELVICIKGTFSLTCRDRFVSLMPGDVMIAFPHDIHSYTKKGEGQAILIIANPSFLPRFMRYFENKFYENYVLLQDKEMITLSKMLLQEFESDASEGVMVGYMYVLLGKIFKTLPKISNHRMMDTSTFAKVVEYLSENYTRPISLQGLAHQFGIDPCHLSRSFTAKLSCSFLRYLHELRVECAQGFLQNYPEKNITAIAFESGFSDLRTFNRVFKQITGQTPREYRTEHTV